MTDTFCQKKEKKIHLFLSLSPIQGERGERMNDLITSELSFLAIQRVENKNIFSFSSLKGKE